MTTSTSQHTSDLPRRRSSIRRSRPDDLLAIRAWLEEEDAQGVHGNFLCNWRVIDQAHQERELLVYVDGRSGLPIAFQLGHLLCPGILQVRNEYRGTGIGRKMVEHCIKQALKYDQCLLFIQCKPSSSIPFWQRMGFTHFVGDRGENNAYKILEKPLPLPDDGKTVRVAIRFYPEDKKYDATTPPYTSHAPVAKRLLSGTVRLGQRVLFHQEAYPDPECRDVVVEVDVDGQCRYLDKAKYEEAELMGIRRCKNGWYVDALFPE